MRILRLEIQNLRCIAKASLQPESGINIISGANGSGKSSLIEAISLLGYSRSFSGSKTSELIRFDEELLGVFADITNHQTYLDKIHNQTSVSFFSDRVGFGYDRQQIKTTRYNSEQVSTDTLVSRVPIIILSPNSFDLIDGPTNERRKCVDWGVFHVKPEFKSQWRRYKKILLQRNSALKVAKNYCEVSSWSNLLCEQAYIVNSLRDDYMNKLIPLFVDNLDNIGFKNEIVIEIVSGWNSSANLVEQLEQGFQTDKRVGATQKGAHRYGFHFLTRGYKAKRIFSRGEKKRIVAAFLLAQVELLTNITNKRPLFLLDDLASEFDDDGIASLFNRVSLLCEQTFITAIDERLAIKQDIQAKFHMKQGKIFRLL